MQGGVLIADNSQSRKWQLTLNNIEEHDITDDLIRETLNKFIPTYYCWCKEIGNKTHTPHVHIFIYSNSPIRFSTLKNRFPIAHIEKAYGTIQENIDYIKKEGKWKDTDKNETIIEGSFEEYGEVPTELIEKDAVMGKLLEDIKDGKSTLEIIEDNPSLSFRIHDIDTIRQAYLNDKYSKENRDIVCTYLFGPSGCGKSFSIFKKYGAENICRITNYGRSGRGVLFDNFKPENSTLVFEEFHSQIPIEDMLNYLDIYPISLPARYNDKVACYTNVFITSNLPLDMQYLDIRDNMKMWPILKALYRRIHNIIEFKEDGSVVIHKLTKGEAIENARTKDKEKGDGN